MHEIFMNMHINMHTNNNMNLWSDEQSFFLTTHKKCNLGPQEFLGEWSKVR